MGEKFKKIELGKISKYSTQKIFTNSLTVDNYVSTENMLPNKEGVVAANSLPSSNKVNSYSEKDILISNIRPYFKKIWLANKNGGCSSDVLVLKINDNINQEYVYYALLNDAFFDYIMVGAKGAKMPRGDKSQILKYEIPFPTEEEQEKIVSKILPFDKKIKSNLRVINMANEILQLLFHKWFIEFKFPNKYGDSYKDDNGNMHKVNGKDIPVGWEFKNLNEIVEKITKIVTPKDNPDKIYKHYSIPIFDDTKLYGEELGKNILSNKYIVNKDNLLVSKLNPWFKRIIYPIGVDEAVCSTEFVVWKPLKDNLLEYLYVVANTNKFTNYCTNASSGTSNSHKRVNPDYMMKFKVPYNEEIAKQFNILVNPIVKKINLLIIENKNLKEMRDLLIKKLIR